MQKIRFLFILMALPFSLIAQQKVKIVLKDNESGSMVKSSNATHLKKPIFEHQGATLSCDSALFYTERNIFEAFSNVHINQGDTINIYSDHLTYDGNTKIAHLTSNVRMIDRSSILTTNILDYNTGTKIGTYVDGGKIVNKDVTITSKRGFYLSSSDDAYFRFDVVAVTPQVRITSDTLRYNTKSNLVYFYGPTDIKGKEDNLYTENGAYNTKTEYAFFGKKNLYTNGARSLKGDSLYYDGIKGIGKAVRNIVFRDTSDKTVMYGQLGFYYRADERALVTKNPYVGLGTADSVKINGKMRLDTLWLGADTLETQKVLQKKLVLIASPVLSKDNELADEEPKEPAVPKPTVPVTPLTDSLSLKPKTKEPEKNPSKPDKAERKRKRDKDKTVLAPDSLSKTTTALDSIPLKVPDSLTQKANLLKTDSLVRKTDSLQKKTDTLARKALSQAKGASNALKPAVKAALKKPGLKDSILKDTTITSPADTIRTRIIKAYHNVRVFKSNMQAVADSLFYTSADSTLRWYGKPILWSQNSQQTGDTIYLRLRNKKLHTMQTLRNSFLVNVNSDSAKFNQVKGKLITAFFTNGEISNVFVDGNAESVYYNMNKDSAYTDMNQTVSSRIKILFKNKKITKLSAIKNPEGARTPMGELKEDIILTGFIWKPELRPLSKKEVINGKPKPKPTAKTPAAKKPVAQKIPKTVSEAKLPLSPGALKKQATDALKKVVPAATTTVKKADSLISKEAPAVQQILKKSLDTAKADSLIEKLQPAPSKKQ